MVRTLLALLAIAMLAGCLDDSQTDSDDVVVPDDELDYELPETVTDAGQIPLGFHWDCIQSCPTIPFTLMGNTSVTAHLQWPTPLFDNDFFVYDANGRVVIEGLSIDADEKAKAVLGAGDYVLEIVPYESAPEDYTLEIAFEFPPVQDEEPAEESSFK